MKIIKRDGREQEVSFDKIIDRIKYSSENLSDVIEPVEIAQKVISYVKDGIHTKEIDEVTAKICMDMSIIHPDFQELASNIIISNLHKNTITGFSDKITILYKNRDHDGKLHPLVSKRLYRTTMKYKTQIDKMMDYERDFLFDYFGYKTLERSYLLRIRNKDGDEIIERPQDMFMRVSLALHDEDLEQVKKSYDLLSQKYFTHASPTLFNAGTNRSQYSSCFLLYMGDSIDGIYKCISDCAHISKWSGGLGVCVSDIRGKNSLIRGTNGRTDGIIPMLRVLDTTSVYVNQCFTPETIIYTLSGPKQISEIVRGESVITRDGTYKRVNEVYCNKVSKDILEIRTQHSFESIRVTNEHELYVIRDQAKMLNYDIIKNRLKRGTIRPEYISASKLGENDLVGYPIIKNNNRSIENLDYYRMYGLMLGDGHITVKMNKYNEYGITLNSITKKDSIEFVQNYLSSHNIKFWEVSKEGCVQIRWSGDIDITYDDLYDNNKEKYIKSDLFKLSKDQTLMLLKGLIDSDGSNLKELYFHTSSYQLAHSFRYLMLKIGIPTSGNIRNNIGEKHLITSGTPRWIETKKFGYVIRIPKHPLLHKILSFQQNGHYFKYFEYDGMIWSRIKDIATVHYEGNVYDLNIQDNHNYVVGSFGLVHNSGKRKGAIAVYLEPHHPDILDFLDLRKNHGKEEHRARNLFTAIWLNDYFIQRVKEDKSWSLFCPDECPGLSDNYGKAYEELYLKYESEGKARKTLKARDVWKAMIVSQIETGTPYMANKDAVNTCSNQNNIGTIKTSNLCIEVMEVSNTEEYAVCTLASLCLPSYVENGEFNHAKLREVVHQVVVNLNKIIDYNFYPVKETKKSNMRHRPMGIGVQGLADVYLKMKIAYDSEEAMKVNKEIFETIYYAALEQSVTLAVKDGPYETYHGCPLSFGKFQFDLWRERGVDVEVSNRWDWEGLRQDIMNNGVRNSLLVALMPTASTSQIMGNQESFEPYTSNVFTRKTLAGNFTVINKYLINELIEMGLWTHELRQELIRSGGSVQGLDIPDEMKARYKTIWEIKQKVMIDQSADRGPFVCQSQSLNLYFENPQFQKINSALLYAHKRNLKTMSYYIRTRAASDAIQFTVEHKVTKEENVSQVEEIEDDEVCVACSG